MCTSIAKRIYFSVTFEHESFVHKVFLHRFGKFERGRSICGFKIWQVCDFHKR